VEKTLWVVIVVMVVLAVGGFLFNIFAWAAIPAVIILAIALGLGWMKRKPRGEPGPPE
jgi:hypothetical protein